MNSRLVHYCKLIRSTNVRSSRTIIQSVFCRRAFLVCTRTPEGEAVRLGIVVGERFFNNTVKLTRVTLERHNDHKWRKVDIAVYVLGIILKKRKSGRMLSDARFADSDSRTASTGDNPQTRPRSYDFCNEIFVFYICGITSISTQKSEKAAYAS